MSHELPRGVGRDPDTGEFVSTTEGAAIPWHETDRVEGTVQMEIPAADLSGGSVSHTFENANVLQVFDFDNVVDDDEVFEIVYLHYQAWLNIHTTATAEGFAELRWSLQEDLSGTPPGINASPPFFLSSPVDVGDGPIDAANDTRRYDDAIATGALEAENSAADSTNGLGLGASYDDDRRVLPLRSLFGVGPVVAADDGWFFVGTVHVDNVSDLAVTWGIRAEARGVTHEI